ncbi:MAG: nitrate reductase cytochrome c-type subunit; periplasmic nitrate reductase electron transfer subunit [Epsilonproteobacteria bacterium]|nr:nitrate reductase cytochrome c-type subunit; periplasmic nitrate reductase electron transfer subunit [Campylobacterota bacterium]
MKTMSKVALSVAVVGFLVTGCAMLNSGSVSDESLSLRRTAVQSEKTVKLAKVEYTKALPGEAKVIERSFDNAPPLIPHSVVGLVPITIKNNSCLGCHSPAVASSVGATSIPKSHFVNFRPIEVIARNGKLIKKGKIVARPNGGSNDVYATYTKNKLYAGRYNCTQCHVSQSDSKLLVKNTFTPGYRSKSDMQKSSLINNFDEGINTIK